MKFADLVAALAASYKFAETAETATAASVKAFITKENINVTHDGKPVDVDAAYKAHTAKPLALVSDETDTATANQKAHEAKSAAITKAAGVLSRANPEDAGSVKTFAIGNSQRNAYNARVKSMGVGKAKGQPKFGDADTAEACAASIRLAICGNVGYAQKKNDLAIVGKAQVEFDNTLGGYTVPPEFFAQLMYLTEPYGVARKLANVRTMTRDVQMQPRKTGIPTMGWVSEGATSTVQNTTYDNVELTAKKLQLLMEASNELLEDAAVSIADDIAASVAEAYDIAIDSAYFLGDSTSTYGGFSGLTQALPAAAYINGAGNWAAFTTGDFNKALGSIQNVNSGRIVMVGSRQFFHQVCMRLEKATSQFKNLAEGAIGGADASFLGYPFYFSEVMPVATGSSVRSVYIGDLVGATMIGERRDLTIMASEHAAFSRDSIQYRATARASIAIHGDGRGSTIGPVACLLATS